MTQRKLVEKIVEELDYDIWKELFYHGEGDEFAEDTISRLIEIVHRYDLGKLEKTKIKKKNLGRNIKPKRKK
jgi:hypothetical protein